MKFSIYSILVLLFISCASHEPLYKHVERTDDYPSDKDISRSFYLIGDAGYSAPGSMSDGLKIVHKYLSTQKTTGNYAIFLGDNIYPSGMPPEGHPERKDSEYRLDAQYEAVKDYDGELIFIPGNHDWYNEGVIGLKRQEDYFESKIKDRSVFKPNNGCPLESITVSEDIQLILVDTQWYLVNWNQHPAINENCDIKTREKFFIELSIELQKHRNKTIIFAMHHPMFTTGAHGGHFAANKHLYPTQKKIPMPGLASLVAQIRAQGGVSIQDRYNELYNDLMLRLKTLVADNPRIIFASGHEHTLQYHEQDGLKQIVSGSGSKGGFAGLGDSGLFSSGGQGFAVLDVFKDGSSWVRFYGDDGNQNPKLLYEKEVLPPTVSYKFQPSDTVVPDTVETAIYTQDSITEALFFKTVWGEKYKEIYSRRVEARVARLDSMYGGLKVIRQGSGTDYKAIILQDSFGNRFRMRALRKNALQYATRIATEEEASVEKPESQEEEGYNIPDSFDENFYTASHPYAIMAIPGLASEINVFYTRPYLYYVPKQEALGRFNEEFGNELYFISIEPTDNSAGQSSFLYPDDIETTDDILIKVRKRGEIFVDEANYIRSRMFDMLIGDWDRESDHWRWAEYFNSDSLNVYVPIPQNRDDAFASFEGDIFDIASSIFGKNRVNHVYDKNLTDLAWFNKEGIILDRALLQRSGKAAWIQQAEFIKTRLSDEVIDTAFSTLPDEVRDETLEEIIEKLKGRRENLVSIAEAYFNLLARLQTVVGTDYSDFIEITREPDGNTKIEIYRNNRGEKGQQFVDRVYSREETDEIWVYGLDGNDVIVVDGPATNNAIQLRVIGGQESDTYRILNGNNLKVYDHESKPDTIEINNGANIRETDVYTLNTYDYRKQIVSSSSFNAAAGYNPDDGLKAGLQYVFVKNGFQRNPFSLKHTVTGGYYSATSSFDLEYEGELANIKNDLNLSFGARITSPNYTVNFFGFGNETVYNHENTGLDANRVELQTVAVNAGLLRNSSFGSFYKLQTTFAAVTVQSDLTTVPGFVLTDIPEPTTYFGTARFVYNYRSFDIPRNPSRGMMFDLNLGGTTNLEEPERIFGFLNTRLGFYNALSRNKKFVLKTNVQAQFNFSDNYEFYQAVSLGGENGLRSFREERFSGSSALVGSADFRYSFNEFKIGLIPLQIGIYTGADLGKVWHDSVSSEKWHNSYGGGLWINGSGGLTGSASAFRGAEGTRYVFGLGFLF